MHLTSSVELSICCWAIRSSVYQSKAAPSLCGVLRLLRSEHKLHRTKAPLEMLHRYLPVSLFDLLFYKLSKKSKMPHSDTITSLFCVCATKSHHCNAGFGVTAGSFFYPDRRTALIWSQEFVFKYMCTLMLCFTLQCGQCAFERDLQNVETSLLLLMGYCWSGGWWNRFKLSSFLSNTALQLF